MFGYPAVFVNGNMFAGLVRNSMVLRLGENGVARFLELPGAKPFIAMGGRRMKAWAIVQPAMVKSPSVLAAWLRKALAYGRTLPPKTVKRRR